MGPAGIVPSKGTPLRHPPGASTAFFCPRREEELGFEAVTTWIPRAFRPSSFSRPFSFKRRRWERTALVLL